MIQILSVCNYTPLVVIIICHSIRLMHTFETVFYVKADVMLGSNNKSLRQPDEANHLWIRIC